MTVTRASRVQIALDNSLFSPRNSARGQLAAACPAEAIGEDRRPQDNSSFRFSIERKNRCFTPAT
jgi:hypothetical protein